MHQISNREKFYFQEKWGKPKKDQSGKIEKSTVKFFKYKNIDILKIFEKVKMDGYIGLIFNLDINYGIYGRRIYKEDIVEFLKKLKWNYPNNIFRDLNDRQIRIIAEIYMA